MIEYYSVIEAKFPMDRLDYRILSILQKDGQISMSALSQQVGLSLSACHRRVKLLESEGVISSYAARLNRKALGLEIQVFMEIKLVSQRREDTAAFELLSQYGSDSAQGYLMARPMPADALVEFIVASTRCDRLREAS